MNSKKSAVSYDSALLKMADLCSRSEHCSRDIIGKLARYPLSGQEIEKIVVYLRDRDFINDRRFAGSFCRDKLRFNGWGKIRLDLELRRRGIDRDCIYSALDDISYEEYFEKAMELSEVKARRLDMSVYSDRVKLFRYLSSKGFESGIISDVLKRLLSKESS